MAKFISEYPELVILFIGVLFSLVGCLIAVVGMLLKDAIDRLNKTILTLTINHDDLETKVILLDTEFIKHKTMCDVCRQSCPGFDEQDERRHMERRNNVTR